MKPQTPEEFAETLRNLYEIYWVEKDDEEVGHIYMDDAICDLLRSLGYGEAVEVFNRAPKYYA